MDTNIFQTANNITEVYTLSRKLKEEGNDVAEVNRLATIRKKELVSKVNSVNSLNKVIPKSNTMGKTKYTNFMLQVVNINSGLITLTRDNTVII